MWTPQEEWLFELAEEAVNKRRFVAAEIHASKLFEMVERDGQKRAYVLALEGVALLHLNLINEAWGTFEMGFRSAMSVKSYAVAAYVLTDWSTAATSNAEAVDMIKRANKLLGMAKSTPDKKRTLVADAAYVDACLARILYRQGKRDEARERISKAQKILGDYAYGAAPYYLHMYLLSLQWALSMYAKGKTPERLRAAFNFYVEALRQRKGGDYVKAVLGV